MSNEEKLIKSFKNPLWKFPELVDKLVKSGFFFTSKEDITKCYYCGIEIKNWALDLEPDVIHKRMSLFCPIFLKENFTSKKERLKTFKNWTNNKISIEKLAESGFIFLGKKDITQCFTCKLKLEDWNEQDEPDVIHNKLSKTCEFLNASKKENEIEKYNCSICMIKEKNTCFLPCAHVVCCLDCCVTIEDTCPLCNTNIDQKIRIFI